MERLVSKMVKRFRFKSIFVSQLAVILSCCIILCAAFSVFFVEISVQSASEHQSQLNQAYVDTLSNNMDYLVEGLEQSLTQLSYSRNISSLIYATTLQDDAANRVMTDVAQTENNNSLIDHVLLYLPGKGYVIGGNYKKYQLDDSPYSQMIRSHSSGDVNGTVIENNTKRSLLFVFDNEAVIARDFPLFGENRLATIYYILDMPELYRHLTEQAISGSRIWGYDGFGNHLFDGLAEYPKLGEEPEEQQERNGVFTSISHKLGWTLVYQIGEESGQASGWNVFWKICPAMLLILACVSLLSFFSAARLYRPFNQLMATIESKKVASDIIPSLKNELDYIDWAFSELISHQEELDTIVQGVSNDIITRFFSDCINGTQITYANSKKILSSANSSFKTNAYYVVCIVGMAENPAEGIHTKENRENLGQLLEIFRRNQGGLYHILEMKDIFTIILSFEEDRQPLNVRKDLVELRKMFGESGYFQKKQTVMGTGRLYRSILDVGFSYQDALKELLKERQHLKESSHMVEDIEEEDVRQEEQVYEERAHQVFGQVENGDLVGAGILAGRLLEEIEMTFHEDGAREEACKIFVGTLLADATSLEYADFSRFSGELQQDPIKYLESLEKAEKMEYARKWCKGLLEELDKMFKKQQNHYILAAQDYIRDHCSDPNLSLNMIAEAIHVNSSYLSKLFKSGLGIYFTDYLNKFRVNYSIQFLEDTDKTIKEIAGECGYGSVQNYIRVFKKYMNQSPGQYRSEVKRNH